MDNQLKSELIKTDIPEGYILHGFYRQVAPGVFPYQSRWNVLILIKDEETDEDDEDAVLIWDNSKYSLFTNPLASAPFVGDAITNFNRVEKSLLKNL